jgi:hypothetical protein
MDAQTINALAPSTSAIEFKIDTDGQALMRVKETGTVTLYFAHRPANATAGKVYLHDASGRKYAVGTMWRNGDTVMASWPHTSVRFHQESYRARGTAQRPSDRVTGWERWIGGRYYSFARVVYGDTRETVLRVFRGRTTETLHEIRFND